MIFPALVQPVALPLLAQLERRAALRHMCKLEAVSRSVDEQDGICWGAKVHDISATGVGVSLCYPFRPGTYLAIDVQSPTEHRSLLGRVVRVTDQPDGTWLLGCELVEPLDDRDLNGISHQ